MSGKEVDISNVEFEPLTNDRVIKISEIDVADFDYSNVSEDMYICVQTYTPKRQGDFTCKKSMFIEEIQPDYIKKKSLGRYTIIEAALTLERNAGADPDAMIDKLKSSIVNGDIDVYAPEKTDRYTPDKVREYYEEVYWDDLNQWLKNNEKRITWTFPEPKSTITNTNKPSSKPTIWWQTEYNILEKAKAVGAKLVRDGNKPSIRAVANLIALDIGIAEKSNKKNRSIDPNTIRNTTLKGWKYEAD